MFWASGSCFSGNLAYLSLRIGAKLTSIWDRLWASFD